MSGWGLAWRAALGVLAVLAVLAAWWWWPRAGLPEPPLPDGVEEEEVREAIEQARQAVKAEPRSARAWGQLGLILLAHLFDREAVACFEVASRLDPADPHWPYARGLVAQHRDPQAAPGLFRQAADAADSAGDRETAWRLALAEALVQAGRDEEAEAEFRAVRQKNPDSARAALGLGRLVRKAGDAEAARGLFEQARNSPAARKAATGQLAALARAAGERQRADQLEAEAAAMEADAAWPDPVMDLTGRMVVGERFERRLLNVLEQQHRYQEAAELHAQRARRRPSVEDYCGAAVNYARLGDFEKAIPWARQAVAHGAGSAQANYTVGLLLYEAADRASGGEPVPARLAGAFAEAAQYARKAAEADRSHWQAHLRWGLCHLRRGEPKLAAEPLRRGLLGRPGNFDLHLSLAHALGELGDPEAGKHLQAAAQARPGDARPRELAKRLKIPEPSPPGKVP